MTVIYLLLATVGVVLTIPALFRAVDLHQRDAATGFAGFAALVAGVVGLVLVEFSVPTIAGLVAAVALGLAAGFLHTELLNLVSPAPQPASTLEEDADATY